MPEQLNYYKDIPQAFFPNADDLKRYNTDFRLLCAILDQTPAERIAFLIHKDLTEMVKDAPSVLTDKWGSQVDLFAALDKEGLSVTRMTLFKYRENGKLPAEYFATTKIDPNDPKKATQRVFYRIDKCVEFFKSRANKQPSGGTETHG